jgi:hypothetical protein
MRACRIILLHLILSACITFDAWSDPISWCSSRTSAVEQALNSGRLILLLAGRETCGNCQYMKYTVCELASVRAVLDADYVCWFCPIDTSTEWYAYSGGLGTFTLPLICVIDPGNPLAYLDRTTGIQYESVFLPRLQGHRPPDMSALEAVGTAAGGMRILFTGASGCTYRVLAADDLWQSWRTARVAVATSDMTLTSDVPFSTSAGVLKVIGFR